MHLSKQFLLAGYATAVGLAASNAPGINVYFGQTGTESLASYCDSNGFDTVTLAFVSASPEADPATNYPTTNFGKHCGTGVFQSNSANSHLLSGCQTLSKDIQYCQKQGKKVLLSVGGVWGSDAQHNYNVSTAANGEYFAEFLWKSFGPPDPTWDAPRPFDVSSEQHTVMDGFDFDIEVNFANQTGYVTLLKKLRSYIDGHNNVTASHAMNPNNDMIITGAPLCSLNGTFQMKDMITQAAFDRLWVQFYNNKACQASGSGFNYDQWEKFLAGTASKNARLYVGLPASKTVNGYVSPDKANAIVDRLQNRPNFGGVMIWDVAIAKANPVQGVPFYEAVHNHMLAAPNTTTNKTTAAPVSIITATVTLNSNATATAAQAESMTEAASISSATSFSSGASSATLAASGSPSSNVSGSFSATPTASASLSSANFSSSGSGGSLVAPSTVSGNLSTSFLSSASASVSQTASVNVSSVASSFVPSAVSSTLPYGPATTVTITPPCAVSSTPSTMPVSEDTCMSTVTVTTPCESSALSTGVPASIVLTSSSPILASTEVAGASGDPTSPAPSATVTSAGHHSLTIHMSGLVAVILLAIAVSVMV